jgi:hypothetical protein
MSKHQVKYDDDSSSTSDCEESTGGSVISNYKSSPPYSSESTSSSSDTENTSTSTRSTSTWSTPTRSTSDISNVRTRTLSSSSDSEESNTFDIKNNRKIDKAFTIFLLSLVFQYITYFMTCSLFISAEADNFSVILGVIIHVLMFILNVSVLNKFPYMIKVQKYSILMLGAVCVLCFSMFNFELLTKRMGTLMDTYSL